MALKLLYYIIPQYLRLSHLGSFLEKDFINAIAAAAFMLYHIHTGHHLVMFFRRIPVLEYDRFYIRVDLAEKPRAIYAPNFSQLGEVVFVEQ